MKTLVLLLAASLLVLCGCASHYVMKLGNGEQILVYGKPRLEGSAYYYKDGGGKEHMLPEVSVVEIEPASMAREKDDFFDNQP
jgi:hypothetical protein